MCPVVRMDTLFHIRLFAHSFYANVSNSANGHIMPRLLILFLRNVSIVRMSDVSNSANGHIVTHLLILSVLKARCVQ